MSLPRNRKSRGPDSPPALNCPALCARTSCPDLFPAPSRDSPLQAPAGLLRGTDTAHWSGRTQRVPSSRGQPGQRCRSHDAAPSRHSLSSPTTVVSRTNAGPAWPPPAPLQLACPRAARCCMCGALPRATPPRHFSLPGTCLSVLLAVPLPAAPSGPTCLPVARRAAEHA